MEDYLEDLDRQIRSSLCLHNFPCQLVERHNKPEIEFQDSSELILSPVVVQRGEKERCLIEQSVNSTRISFCFKSTDATEEYLMHTYLRFMMHRAEQLEIVRRVPLPGYHVSFLVTNYHLERYSRDRLVQFILTFVRDLSKQISDAKLSLKSRSRAIVENFWEVVATKVPTLATAT